MHSYRVHPYRTPSEISHIVDRVQEEVSPLVHPQQIMHALRQEEPALGRFNGWLADHIVGIAGTMGFFYFLCVVLAGWSSWQSLMAGDKGFDPFPYAFLFFLLGGIMQSLFVPTMLTASNRATLRDRIKDESDHRAWSHLYDCQRRAASDTSAAGRAFPSGRLHFDQAGRQRRSRPGRHDAIGGAGYHASHSATRGRPSSPAWECLL